MENCWFWAGGVEGMKAGVPGFNFGEACGEGRNSRAPTFRVAGGWLIATKLSRKILNKNYFLFDILK